MGKSKKFVATLLTAVMLASATYSASAMPLFYAEAKREGFNVMVLANTTKNVKTSSTSYGLKKGKYVNKVTIRLVEGKYDKSKSTNNGTIKISKLNNPFKTATGTWHWTYK